MSFSLKYLFAFIALAAIYTAALVYSTPLWACLAINLGVVIFLTAPTGVVLRQLNWAFWAPFCVFGWFYLAVAFIPTSISRLPQYLPSEQIVKLVDPDMKAALDVIGWKAAQPPIDGFDYTGDEEEQTFLESVQAFQRFADVVHTLFALWFAAAAAVIPLLLFRREREA